MSQRYAKATAKEVEKWADEPGRHAVGDSLYLLVSGGSKRWTFVYRFRRQGSPPPGKRWEYGLGAYPAVSLSEARKKAADARQKIRSGVNPVEERRVVLSVPTFGQMSDQFVALRSAEMRNDKAVYRLKRSLEVHAAGLRSMPVNEVGTQDVVDVLKPIWSKTPDAASKVRATSKGCWTSRGRRGAAKEIIRPAGVGI
jgi:hypothetical protein